MTSPPPPQLPPLRPSLDIIGEDLLQNVFTRLPATSFAYAACVSRSWNVVCDRVLCRPLLKSACSFNSSLTDAVEDVVNKVLDEPIRPHFVIASVGPSYSLAEAHQLITAKLGPNVPIITNNPSGVIGRDAVSNEFKEIQWEVTEEDDDTAAPLHLSESANRAIMLIIGFLPGIKVEAIPLLKRTEEPQHLMVDNFVTDIREFSTSISGSKSPAAIIMFSEFEAGMKAVAEKMDYAMSLDTVIVGDGGCHFLHSNGCSRNPSTSEEHSTSAVALVFAVDRNKSPGIGETQFHATLSSGLSPVGPTYKAASVREKNLDSVTWLTARIEGTNENIDGETILNQVYDELGDRIQFPTFYIGVTKKRKCAIGKEKVGLTTSLAFHEVLGSVRIIGGEMGVCGKLGDWSNGFVSKQAFFGACSLAWIEVEMVNLNTRNGRFLDNRLFGKQYMNITAGHHSPCKDNQEYLFVGDVGIRTGDTFRFYHSDSTTALSSITTITNQFSSLKQASTSNGDKREVFGGLIFTCCGRGESFFGQSDVDSSPFLANFTGVTFAGTFCGGEIGRGDLTSYVKESHEQKSIRCCLHVYSAVYLVMSYTPPKGNQRQL